MAGQCGPPGCNFIPLEDEGPADLRHEPTRLDGVVRHNVEHILRRNGERALGRNALDEIGVESRLRGKNPRHMPVIQNGVAELASN